MDAEFIDLTPENIEDEHLCCIIRTKKGHPGIEAKRAWLKERLSEGHVFRKLNVKGCAFIEYAPLEAAWVPVVGDNFYYIYCLWVQGEPKGHGYGRTLMESCIEDARARQVGRVYARRGEAEGVAVRPELCEEVRLHGGGQDGQRL